MAKFSFKQSQKLPLSAFGLNYNEVNLFDDIYGQKLRVWSELGETIIELEKNNNTNFLRIGRNLLEALDGNISYENMNNFLNFGHFQFKRTQAIKYIETYNYCNQKFKNNQPTDGLLELGIEKVYLVTKLENKENQERLEQFIVEENLTVKQLTELVDVLNGKSEILKLANKFSEQKGGIDVEEK